MNKVITLKTAKALHDAGIRVESERIYTQTGSNNWILLDSVSSAIRRFDLNVKKDTILPAPDTQELLDALPSNETADKTWSIYKLDYSWEVSYGEVNERSEFLVNEVSLPEGLAHLLIHLHKEGIV